MFNICYVGDGVQTEFPFAFPFFQNDDVRIAVNQKVIPQKRGVYSIVPNPDFTGGTVVFAVAPDKDAAIEIFRQISLNRVIDYQPTMPIDPECLNADFNFLLAALGDLRAIDIDLMEWSVVHADVLRFLEYTNRVVEDKLGGGAVLGLYNNLLAVLESAQPYLINDYGSITEPAPNEKRDDYGIL